MKNYLVFICLVLIFGCKKDQVILVITEPGLVIKYGSVCGWCAGEDSLTIKGNNLQYVLHNPCENKTTTKYLTITDSQKADLLNTLDYWKFEKIKINTCNICVDGCDIWISVKDGNFFHDTRGGENTGDLSSIENFIDQLNLLKLRIRNSK